MKRKRSSSITDNTNTSTKRIKEYKTKTRNTLEKELKNVKINQGIPWNIDINGKSLIKIFNEGERITNFTCLPEEGKVWMEGLENDK